MGTLYRLLTIVVIVTTMASCSGGINPPTPPASPVPTKLAPVIPRDPRSPTRVSIRSDGTQGDHASQFFPSLSYDGMVVAFSSAATSLDTGIEADTVNLFVHDRSVGTTRLVTSR